MAKKDKNHGSPVPAAADPAAPQSSNPPVPVNPAPAAQPDVSKKYFLIFWGLIVLAAAAAWILAVTLPGISEAVNERWLMAALAASLTVFLILYRNA